MTKVPPLKKQKTKNIHVFIEMNNGDIHQALLSKEEKLFLQNVMINMCNGRPLKIDKDKAPFTMSKPLK